MTEKRRRLGIFGWGIVAPRSPDVHTFRKNLDLSTSWLESYSGFGPSHFLVGPPEFDFDRYREWIDERFEPRRYSQVRGKSGTTVKYAVGAFIQALGQNPGLEQELQSLGDQAHVYVGTGLGDFPLLYETSLAYRTAQERWNRFWCQPPHHPELERYRATDPERRPEFRASIGAPDDPADRDPETPEADVVLDAWFRFWLDRSEGLKRYLEELLEIERTGIQGDIEVEKAHVIRRKISARRRLCQKWGCPPEPWDSVDAKILWNLPNIPAAQISMLGRITGPSLAPIAACAGFGSALKLADNAIQLGEAKAVVVGMTDPEPHPLSVGSFFRARVVSHDARVSKPFTEMRGTHISGGACVWIVGDAEYFMARGMKPLGLEIVGIALSSDADHIITPSAEGPQRAMRGALAQGGLEPSEIESWDMHATATPGDWSELQNALAVFGPSACLTARKGTFGHGMSVCGGWELTAQHMGVAEGRLHPIDIAEMELHPQMAPYHHCLVGADRAEFEGGAVGKINMGIGGVNACVVCRPWA